jgi:four helix bundle protein
MGKNLSNEIWEKVITWDILPKKTISEQLVRAMDSVSANIAEGFGRFHKKDKVKFYYNARASVYESAHWINLALERNLIEKGIYDKWIGILRKLPKEINTLIKLTIENLKQ